MPEETTRLPTDSELAILTVVWARGETTVREVFNELSSTQGMGYTTVLKFMQIMTAKGLLVRDTTVRPQLYRAAEPQGRTQRGLVGDLLDRAFAGSAGSLALQALSLRKASTDELRAIRDLIDSQITNEEAGTR